MNVFVADNVQDTIKLAEDDDIDFVIMEFVAKHDLPIEKQVVLKQMIDDAAKAL